MATLTTTTTTTTTIAATQPPPGLPLDFLPFVDMTTLSQSELRSLSFCSSSSSLDLRRSTTDVISPTSIDRSSFNESAGSRRQTYSRPSSHHHHRHRVATLLHKTPNLPNPNTPPAAATNTSTDPDRIENRSIIGLLKQLLSSHPDFQQLGFLELDIFSQFNNFSPVPVAEDPVNVRKRKRGRKPKVKVLDGDERGRRVGLEIVNKNGEVVDLERLAALEDPFKEELRRRTEGLEKEAELLGFFRELGGQWCSRRRKRKIVDASEFGDFLPVGWKLILGIKRKIGHAWVYCRRYVSPGGQQLVSCKDVSAYLQSFFGPNGSRQVKVYENNLQQELWVASDSHAGASEREEEQRYPMGLQTDMTLLGIENLAEVQIRDLFECLKCNMTFDEKDTYLQHLLSFHSKTTRRYQLGSSVGDGAIVKDGKYECQFCHKVFHERLEYNDHVATHVRNYERGEKESPVGLIDLQKRSSSSSKDELTMRISKMDALIEIAQNSIQETSGGRIDDSNGGCASDHELDSDSLFSEPDVENGMVENSLEVEFYPQKDDCVIINEKMEKIDDSGIDMGAGDAQCDRASGVLGVKVDAISDINQIHNAGNVKERQNNDCSLSSFSVQDNIGIDNSVNSVTADESNQPKPHGVDEVQDVEVKFAFEASSCVVENDVEQGIVSQSTKDVHQHGVSEQQISNLNLSLSHGSPTSNINLDEGENSFGVIDERQDKEIGKEEVRFQEIEQVKFSFGTPQESLTLPVMEMDLVNSTLIERVYDDSVQFESQSALDTTVNLACGQLLTTVCVWCGVEFSYEALEAEIQSDSVGYMCPTCKAKISGQFNGGV